MNLNPESFVGIKVDSHYRLKAIDFRLSVQIANGKFVRDQERNNAQTIIDDTLAYNQVYVCPEVKLKTEEGNDVRVTTKCDIWSLGMMFVQVFEIILQVRFG